MITKILNTWIVLVLFIVVGGLSLCVSIVKDDFLWLSRSGSIITILGILLTLKHSPYANIYKL